MRPGRNRKHTAMITITDSGSLTAAFEKFQPSGNAEPTNRCMPAPWDDCQEWAEYGDIEGVPAKVFYIFENSDVSDIEDAGDYPWESSVFSILIAELGPDGEYDEL